MASLINVALLSLIVIQVMYVLWKWRRDIALVRATKGENVCN